MPRHSLVRPASTSRVSQPPRGAQRGDQTPVALCKFDEYMMSLVPDYKPMSEKELRDYLYALGATEETYDQYLQGQNRLTERMIQRGGVRVIGVVRKLKFNFVQPRHVASGAVSRVSQPPRAQGAQRGDQTPVALCAFDAHMMSLIPNWKPMNEKELREGMYASGATEETYEQYLQCENRLMEQKIKRDGLLVVGWQVKPLPDDPSVYTVPIRIPDSPYVLRMWEGGMAHYGHFCLD